MKILPASFSTHPDSAKSPSPAVEKGVAVGVTIEEVYSNALRTSIEVISTPHCQEAQVSSSTQTSTTITTTTTSPMMESNSDPSVATTGVEPAMLTSAPPSPVRAWYEYSGPEQRIVRSSVDKLFNKIDCKRQRERDLDVEYNRKMQQQRYKGRRAMMAMSKEKSAVAGPEYSDDTDLEEDLAADKYWWTDVFLRYFVFNEDNHDFAKTTSVADSDDLLFFVLKRRPRSKENKMHKSRRLSTERPERVAYKTRAYRKINQQNPNLLPVNEPSVMWRHTVCLNAIIHHLQYTLTVAVCVGVPRKAGTTIGTDHYTYDSLEDCGLDGDQGEEEYDLQLLSRHVHTVYASTSGRRMDTDKGPRERSVYPALCWAVDDYAEAFRSVVVRPGQTVCVELVASWPGSPIFEKHKTDEDRDNDNLNHETESLIRNSKRQYKTNRVVLFSGAIPYPAVRATYECKMSLYREAERRRRKRRNDERKRCCGKKSSLGAALSASLTALFNGGKDSGADPGDNGYYYGAADTADDRVEYVTVRGHRPSCDDYVLDSSSDDEMYGGDADFENVSAKTDSFDATKGLAQMAVTLAPVQPATEPVADFGRHDEWEYRGEGYDGDYGYNDYADELDNGSGYDDDGGGATDFGTTPVTGYHRQLVSSPYTTTASEPGDFYDYGWDYEIATGSGQHTPQTPMSYRYQQQMQQQQQQQQQRRRRRAGRPRRLSDPCSTSVYDLLDDDDDVGGGAQSYHQYQEQYKTGWYGSGRRKQQYGYQKQQKPYHQHRPSGYGERKTVTAASSAVTTPAKTADRSQQQHPHRAWSESDGLDRCGGGGGGSDWLYGTAGCGGFVPQSQQQIQKQRRNQVLMPPPPVPYYCAAEAAAAGFVQYVRKSPSSWWMRKRNRRRRRRVQIKKQREKRQNNKKTMSRHRSTSAGSSRNGRYTSTTEDGVDGDNHNGNGGNHNGSGGNHNSGSGSNSDGTGDSNSDDQDCSDGEFIGALAAAAAVGHDPEREWMLRGTAGDPIAHWDQYESDSDNVDADTRAAADSDIILEWTTEIMANDIRCTRSLQNDSLPMDRSKSMISQDNEYGFPDRQQTLLAVATPVDANRHLQQQPQQSQCASVSRQNQRYRQPLQFRPKPVEPPPPSPALSVAFTAIACPWWTVLKDVLFVTNANSEEEPSSSEMLASVAPLLTFD